MRIRKLGLRRYGKFTDAFIDFGERVVGNPDLHIVYGPNEAGKSTAMSACTDLIYGIASQSRFNFLHPYSTMRIEADIETSDRIRSFSRIKRPQNSLLDNAGNPVPDTLLLAELGGLDRGAYQTMFCLDDETLEAGGESILASKGDLGHLLFSATAGLADLSDRLSSVQDDAEGFYRPGRRSGLLADLKKNLAALKEEKDRADTLATEYSRFVIERDEAVAAYDDALSQRSRTQARIDEILRLINALPRLQTFRALRAELLPLAPLPDAPSSWNQDLPGLMTRQTKLATQTHVAAETIANLRSELEGLVVNASACGLKSRIELLVDLRARYITAEKDLPDRRLRLALAEQTVARVLTQIDHGSDQEPARLILSTGVTGPLRDLMEQRSGVEAALAAAEAEVEKARDALSEAEVRLAEHGEGLDEATSTTLAAVIANARQSDDSARLSAADHLRRERTDELEDRLVDLFPWTGNRGDLLKVPVPTSDQLQHWISTEANLSRDIDVRQAESDRLDAEAGRLDAKMEALGSAAGIISDQEAGEARSAREAAWAVHKAALDAVTAANFETSMRKLDLIAEQRSSHTAGIADLNRALLERAEVRAALERSRSQLQEAFGKRATTAKEIEKSLGAIGLDDAIGVAGLNLWAQKRDRAIEAQGKLTAAERDWQRAQAGAAASQERVAQTMRTAGIEIPLDGDVAAMLVAGQVALNRAIEAKNLCAAVEDRRRNLKSREKKLGDARLAEQVWSAAWRKACAASWLGECHVQPTTAIVRETLEALVELASSLEKKAELTDRIAKMQRDQARFQTEVNELAALIGLPQRPADVLGLCEAVVDGVTSATKTLDRRQVVEARLATEQEKAHSLAQEAAEVESQASLMIKLFGVGALAEVDVCLRSLARRSELEARLMQSRDEILDGVQVDTIEHAEEILDAIDRGSLGAELIELKGRFEDEDRRSRDHFAARNRAEDKIAAVGGDAAVAIIESSRRTILLTIEDKALEYLKLKLGTVAADRALRAYRDRHRSSMMARASQAFALISRGAYSELVTQPSNGSELLIAKGADGSSKVASELSKGTRFQLYLALRVAGYHEFARARAPAPFLADDIMETFDDFRAEEAFRLLAAMATRGQVVYFTHHRHLCEIAKAITPSVKIHRLEVMSPRGWAISILREAGAIRECEEHGWMHDCADPHARERALETARRDPLVGLSDREAVAAIGAVLDEIGDTCPECQPG